MDSSRDVLKIADGGIWVAEESLPKVNLKKVKSGKKKATVYFDKVTGCTYEIQISTSKKVTKARLVKTKKTKCVVKKLKSKKKYWIRVRACKTISGYMVRGEWSNKKKVQVK